MNQTGRPIIIAIDGASSTGKSSIARRLAKRLKYTHIDTGAMYRAVTYHFMTHRVDLTDQNAIDSSLLGIKIRIHSDGNSTRVLLQGQDITQHLRTPLVSDHVSEVAALSAVRRVLVEQQQEMGAEGGIVMDGRDIGTVVFPSAALKIFLHCDLSLRVSRRHAELMEAGVDIDQEEVRQNLLHRDHIDSTRLDSPLRQAEDALRVNNSSRSIDETVEFLYQLALERMPT